jgi:hypothetical protein
LVTCGPMKRWAWNTYFNLHLNEYEAALKIAAGNREPNTRQQFQLPAACRHLTKDGRLRVYTDSNGQSWYVFVTKTVDISNSRGLVWNRDGIPPPEGACPRITSSRRLRPHWFLIQTT